MKDRISKDGNRITSTEYEVRYLNQDGDTQDIDHFGSKREAIVAAKKPLHEPIKATVIEKHVCKRPARFFDQPDIFTTVATFGDKAALELWGWQPGDSTWLEAGNYE